MNLKSLPLSALFLVLGLAVGYYGALKKSHLYPMRTLASGQSEAKSGEIMRGQISLRDQRWLDAHYMTRDCDAAKPINITATPHAIFYVCVKR
ncbi:MAG: hypothetical protein HY390_04915 [Deltaproteobacteria bacterium]|nr:hypothetical protein [Deltaproteobacteria bacterium]